MLYSSIDMKKKQATKKVCYSIRLEDDKLMETLGREYGLPSKSAVLRLALKELARKMALQKIRESYLKDPETEDKFMDAVALEHFKTLDKEEGAEKGGW